MVCVSAAREEPVDLGTIRAQPIPDDPYGPPPGAPLTDSPVTWKPYGQRSLGSIVRSARTGTAGMAHDIVDAHRGPKENSRPLPDWVRGLAWFLDESIPLPAGRRVGVDGVVSIIPGIGDAAGMAASMVVVLAGIGAGVSLPTTTLMMLNVGLDAIFGAIPFLGALFDMGYKANTRNLRLIEKDLHDRRGASRSAIKVFVLSALAIFLSMLLMFVAFFGSLWLFYLLLQRLL